VIASRSLAISGGAFAEGKKLCIFGALTSRSDRAIVHEMFDLRKENGAKTHLSKMDPE
jgi:hypothetical protein